MVTAGACLTAAEPAVGAIAGLGGGRTSTGGWIILALVALPVAEATARSYGMDLLRWYRFLWAVETPWDRASRVEARDFCRWLQVAGKLARRHWPRRDEPAAGEAARGPGGGAYAVSVRAHGETVLRGFYEFHRDAGTGPILNPFPLDRSRRGRRAHAARHRKSRMDARTRAPCDHPRSTALPPTPN